MMWLCVPNEILIAHDGLRLLSVLAYLLICNQAADEDDAFDEEAEVQDDDDDDDRVKPATTKPATGTAANGKGQQSDRKLPVPPVGKTKPAAAAAASEEDDDQEDGGDNDDDDDVDDEDSKQPPYQVSPKHASVKKVAPAVDRLQEIKSMLKGGASAAAGSTAAASAGGKGDKAVKPGTTDSEHDTADDHDQTDGDGDEAASDKHKRQASNTSSKQVGDGSTR